MRNGASQGARQGEGHTVEVSGGIARIALDRAEKMNPLDKETVAALLHTVAALEADDAVRIVRITGRGRAFSAGGDLEGYKALYRDKVAFQAFLDDFQALNRAIEDSGKIYMAVVNGACVAGGLELILACDVVIAADDARIGDCHVNFGQLPGAGGSQRLPRVVGVMHARHLIFTGRLITGAEAARIGLVTLAVPAADLERAADDLSARLLETSPAGLKGAKYLINTGLKGSLADGIEMEKAYVHTYATTEPDAMEGLAAFSEKRKPVFGGAKQQGNQT